jgi:hypothetical protein
MQERCGAWQVGNDVAGGRVEFRVVFPTGPDPGIDAIRVAADFQQTLGGGNWDFARGLPLIQDTFIRPDGRVELWKRSSFLASRLPRRCACRVVEDDQASRDCGRRRLWPP